ncbi:MAG: hypothetical protein ACT4OF_07885 [Caulobacteraceae bacterium]
MSSKSAIISGHRLARLVAWLMAVLAWFAIGAPRKTRAQRRRYPRLGEITIASLRHAVRNVIIMRAAQLLPQSPSRFARPGFAPPGFRRCYARATPRAVTGVWLRRYLYARGSFIAQVRQLIEVLRHYRGLGAALAWRRRFGLTRLRPIIPISPPAEPLCPQFAQPAPAEDSS